MKITLLMVAVAACASAPSFDSPDSAVLRGRNVDQVRDAARAVVEEVAHPGGVRASEIIVRAHEDRVITEGRIGACGRDVRCGSGTDILAETTGTPWTTIEVLLEERGSDTAVQVEIEYRTAHQCTTCAADALATTGFLEQRILDGIRARLERG